MFDAKKTQRVEVKKHFLLITKQFKWLSVFSTNNNRNMNYRKINSFFLCCDKRVITLIWCSICCISNIVALITNIVVVFIHISFALSFCFNDHTKENEMERRCGRSIDRKRKKNRGKIFMKKEENIISALNILNCVLCCSDRFEIDKPYFP